MFSFVLYGVVIAGCLSVIAAVIGYNTTIVSQGSSAPELSLVFSFVLYGVVITGCLVVIAAVIGYECKIKRENRVQRIVI